MGLVIALVKWEDYFNLGGKEWGFIGSGPLVTFWPLMVDLENHHGVCGRVI